MRRKPEAWEDSFGFSPHKVWVGERADKGGTLYLRWWDAARGNWGWRSLGRGLRDAKGKILPDVQAMAQAAARERYEQLTGKATPVTVAEAAPLTLGATWALLTDEKRGKYPRPTPHRAEVGRELVRAVRILGAETAWATVDKAKYRIILRTRVDELRAKGHAALRGAEITMQRLHAVAAWLRDEEHIPATAAVPSSRWREELRSYVEAAHEGRLPAPQRPRYTLEEMRALLEAAWDVDPRYGLLMAVGAELRLGQVARCRRSDLNLDHWTLRVPGRGKKRGTLIMLTSGQQAAVRRALAGYLAPVEGRDPDFFLFPALKRRHRAVTIEGKVKRAGPVEWSAARLAAATHVGSTAIRQWHRAAERQCQIVHQRGRGNYGVRRIAVDAVKAAGISREGLQAHGGWESTQIPDAIYAEQNAEYARREAMEKRAQIRGESGGTVPPPYPETTYPAEGGVRDDANSLSEKEN